MSKGTIISNKKKIIGIIKDKGDCSDFSCSECPLPLPSRKIDRGFACCGDEDIHECIENEADLITIAEMDYVAYERAIELFIEKYGESSLVEELI